MKKPTLLLALILLTSCSQGAAVTETAQTTLTEQTSENAEAAQTTQTSAASEEPPVEDTKHSDALQMSAESGYYAEPFELEITAPEGCKIYYTTDGSVPDSTKTLYTKPIKLIDRSPADNVLASIKGINPDGDYIPQSVKKANIIRAAAIGENGEVLETMSRTFFVGLDAYDIPVISIITDPKNLFNKHDGIYVMGDTFDEWEAEQKGYWQGWQAKGNYSNKGREWERPATREYITADGVMLSQDCGVRMMGAASRNQTQKSMRFIARSDYGKKNFKYPLIPGNMRSDGSGEVEKYRSFVLRNGGNDCDFAKIRDPVLQELMSDTDIETLQYTPVVAFLDGEYWGMYTLIEDYSDHYIENNYGRDDTDVFDDDNIIFLKKGRIDDGQEKDIELYNEMYDFAISSDLNIPENYEKLASMIDLDGLADYAAFNMYIDNTDSYFEGNNWAMWRVRNTDDRFEKADGKWRMMIYDTESSTGIYNDDDVNDNNIIRILEKDPPEETDEDGNTVRSAQQFFHALTKCDAFREKLMLSLCDMRNICFERQRAVDNALRVYGIYSDYVPDTFDRFGPMWVVGQGSDRHFESQMNRFVLFLDARYEKFPHMIADSFGLEKQARLSISYDDAKGSVYLNGKKIPPDFSGIYFCGHPVEITVIPDSGTETVSADGAACTPLGDGRYSLDLAEVSTVEISL